MDDHATPALPEDPAALTAGEAISSDPEDGSPLPGLVNAAKVEVEAEMTDDASAEALLAQMGVEEEGIESGQLVGLMVAVLVSVAALAFALIYLFIIPKQQATADEAEVGAEYPELADARATGMAQLTDYRTVDGGYGIPIERAMEVIAMQGDSTARAADGMTRQEFNTAWIDLSPDAAVRAPGGREALSATDAPAVADDATDVPVVTNEAVGVDDPDDVEPIE